MGKLNEAEHKGQTGIKEQVSQRPTLPHTSAFPTIYRIDRRGLPLPRLRLQGFNNLTKALSFNIYIARYARTEEERQRYIEYIDEEYNADRLTQISLMWLRSLVRTS